jgi:Holliday junction resolvase RusA-like endonuclease
MQAPVSFTVYGTARPKGSHRPFLHPRTKQIILRPASQGLKAWEESIRHEAQRHAEQGVFFGGPVKLLATFVFARPKSVSAKKREHMTVAPDLSKLIRGIEDALTGLLWRDDSQVTEVHARKVYGAYEEPSRVDITLSELTPTQATAPLFARQEAS